MGGWIGRIACLLVCAVGAGAQQESPQVVVNVEGFRYPAIARAARIQGDVKFEVSAAGVMLVDGNPILAGAARVNLETWAHPSFEGGKYLVWYSFRLSDEVGTKQEILPVGNRLDRFFLRLFHAQTTRIVSVCDDTAPAKAHVEGGGNEIHVSLESGGTCLNV